MFKHRFLYSSSRMLFLILGTGLISLSGPNDLGPSPAEAGVICYSTVIGMFFEPGHFASCNEPPLCTNGWNSCEYICYGTQYILHCYDDPKYQGDDCGNDPLSKHYQGCNLKEDQACLLDEEPFPCCPLLVPTADIFFDCETDCQYCY